MDVKIQIVKEESPELVEIRCHRVTADVNEIAAFVKSRHGQLTGSADGKYYEVPVVNLYYIEAVDNRVFLYSAKQVYETKKKLYELEELLAEKNFLRVSKSILLNLMKVKAIKPAFNGRFIAILVSGEEIIISRKYVPNLKNKLKEGKV